MSYQSVPVLAVTSIVSLLTEQLWPHTAFDSSHFYVSFSGGRKSERIERKHETQNPSLGIGMNMENSLAIVMRI